MNSNRKRKRKEYQTKKLWQAGGGTESQNNQYQIHPRIF